MALLETPVRLPTPRLRNQSIFILDFRQCPFLLCAVVSSSATPYMDQTDAGAKAPTIESVPMIVYSILSIKKPYDVENSLHSTHEDVRNARDFFRHTQKQKKVFE